MIALFTMVTTGKGSGIEVKRGDAIVYRLSEDKIARTEYFNDQGAALEAAGLSR